MANHIGCDLGDGETSLVVKMMENLDRDELVTPENGYYKPILQ